MATENAPVSSRVEQVMARVRAKLPGSTQNQGRPSVSRPRVSEDRVFPEETYRSLHQARTIGGALAVDAPLGWRTPVIGPVWMLVRQRIHQEIRIYVDAITSQQTNLNVHLIRVLASVVDTVDGLNLLTYLRRQQEQEDAIAQLRSEVAGLRSHLESLQSPGALPEPAELSSHESGDRGNETG